MPQRKQIKPGEKVGLKLTAAERKLILNDLMCVEEDHIQAIQDTPPGKPVQFTLDELDDLGGCIAGEAVLTRSSRGIFLVDFRDGPQPGSRTADGNLPTRTWHNGQTSQPVGLRDTRHVTESNHSPRRPIDSPPRLPNARDPGRCATLVYRVPGDQAAPFEPGGLNLQPIDDLQPR